MFDFGPERSRRDPRSGAPSSANPIVGWVSATKPFGYPSATLWASAQGNAQQAKRLGVGFRYRSEKECYNYNSIYQLFANA